MSQGKVPSERDDRCLVGIVGHGDYQYIFQH